MFAAMSARFALYAAVLIGLGACSSDPVRPLMEDFAGSVSRAGTTAERAFDDRQLDAGLAELRRSVLAQQSSLYALEERCQPLEPTAVEFSQAPPDFEEVCRLAPKVFDPQTSEIRPASDALPEGDPRVEAANARRLVRGLKDYAEALQTILTTDTRAETAAAAVAALDAVGDLTESAAPRAGDEGLAARVFSQTGRDLVGRASSEILEAYRYRLLKSVVTEADPAVQTAARIVAVWFNREFDRAEVAAAYGRLQSATDTGTPGNAGDLARVEEAYEAARRAEESAGWRVFWQIGVTHAAIVDSFGRSGSQDALNDANSRIFDLAQAVKAFAETQ